MSKGVAALGRIIARPGGANGVPQDLPCATAGLAQDRLQLRKRQLNRIEVRTVFRQKPEWRADGFDRSSHRGALVTRQGVHDDDVAGRERWHQDLLDVGQTTGAVDRPIKHGRRDEACHAQRPAKRRGVPAAIRRVVGDPGAGQPALVHGSRALGEPRSTSWPSWRQQVHDLDMKSRVHPKYKTQYHVGNWPAYDRALVQRGDITVWLAPDAIATWEAVGVGKRGGQRQYSDLAIETALTLRLIFHLPLRQTEGFLTSIFGMLGLDLSAPDHTTLSRRGQHLDLPLRRTPAGAGLHLIVDSTGLSIVGEGEWAAAKHGGRGRRGWKKLHLGVDRSGVIVARALTEASVDDATTGITLIEATDGALGRVTADAAYDTIGFYEAAGARGATVVVPPTRTANVSRYGPRSGARDRTILAVKERGRRRWKKTSGYHGQARVENAFFRYKSIIGDSLRACSPAGRGTEVVLACNILNQMTGLGRPMSYRIGR